MKHPAEQRECHSRIENSHSILRCSKHLDPEDDTGLLTKRGDASVPSNLEKDKKVNFTSKLKYKQSK